MSTPQRRKGIIDDEEEDAYDEKTMMMMMLEHDDEDETEAQPLVACSSPRRIAFETISASTREEKTATCWGDTWRFMASASLLLGPILLFLYSYRNYNKSTAAAQQQANKNGIDFDALDSLQCAKDLQIRFSDLYYTKPASFCSSSSHTHKTTTCHCTDPLIPLARVQSSPKYWPKWDQTFERNKRLAKNANNINKNTTTAIRVVLLGDSITEHWVGTDLGEPSAVAMAVNREFENAFHGQALALGVAGDRCPQLLYRIQNNGELASLENNADAVVVFWLLIGTNDLSDSCSPESILRGQMEIVFTLLKKQQQSTTMMTRIKIVVNSILPRPNPAGIWEGTKYYDSIRWVNTRLECFVRGLQPAVQFFDADPYFLSSDDNTVSQDILPDWLHPSGKASRIWGKAIMERVEQIISLT